MTIKDESDEDDEDIEDLREQLAEAERRDKELSQQIKEAQFQMDQLEDLPRNRSDSGASARGRVGSAALASYSTSALYYCMKRCLI